VVSVDIRSGRFRDERGRVISAARVDALVTAEQQRLSVSLARLTDAMLNNDIRLVDWQLQFRDQIKNTVIRLALLGNFGQPMDEAAWGAVGVFLRREYRYLRRFAATIASGQLTPAQIKARAQLYAGVARRIYERSRKRWHLKNGFTEAKRTLDPNAQHCPECPMYATDWTSVEDIVPVGANCSCGGRCRCRIQYRRSLRQLNYTAAFADAILSEEDRRRGEFEQVLKLVEGRLNLPKRPRPRGFGNG
jgi:hypothetical protein